MTTRHVFTIGACAGAAATCLAQGHIEEALALILSAAITLAHRSLIQQREEDLARIRRDADRERLAKAQEYVRERGLSMGTAAFREIAAEASRRQGARRVIEREELAPYSEAARRVIERVARGDQ